MDVELIAHGHWFDKSDMERRKNQKCLWVLKNSIKSDRNSKVMNESRLKTHFVSISAESLWCPCIWLWANWIAQWLQAEWKTDEAFMMTNIIRYSLVSWNMSPFYTWHFISKHHVQKGVLLATLRILPLHQIEISISDNYLLECSPLTNSEVLFIAAQHIRTRTLRE